MGEVTLSGRARVGSWVGQVLAAAIMGQTLFFKFTAAPETVALFTQLGMEPWGRWGIGLAELLAAVLLLVPRTAPLGGILGVGLMLGAIGSHITTLGIVYNNDGGSLFALAVVTLIASASVVWLRRGQLPVVGPALIRTA